MRYAITPGAFMCECACISESGRDVVTYWRVQCIAHLVKPSAERLTRGADGVPRLPVCDSRVPRTVGPCSDACRARTLVLSLSCAHVVLLWSDRRPYAPGLVLTLPDVSSA